MRRHTHSPRTEFWEPHHVQGQGDWKNPQASKEAPADACGGLGARGEERAAGHSARLPGQHGRSGQRLWTSGWGPGTSLRAVLGNPRDTELAWGGGEESEKMGRNGAPSWSVDAGRREEERQSRRAEGRGSRNEDFYEDGRASWTPGCWWRSCWRGSGLSTLPELPRWVGPDTLQGPGGALTPAAWALMGFSSRRAPHPRPTFPASALHPQLQKGG